MNEEEKEAIECLELVIDSESDIETEDLTNKCINNILNLIKKQQKEIKARLEEIDSLYKMMSAKDDKIDELKKDYQILKDDIEGHRIAYVDTPEFEEKYISKDKIRELKEKVENEMISNPYDFSYMINELLGETND